MFNSLLSTRPPGESHILPDWAVNAARNASKLEHQQTAWARLHPDVARQAADAQAAQIAAGKDEGRFFAVHAGRVPGIYRSWRECAEQVNGFSGAVFQGFSTAADAVQFLGGRSGWVRGHRPVDDDDAPASGGARRRTRANGEARGGGKGAPAGGASGAPGS